MGDIPEYTPEQLKQADQKIGIIRLVTGRTAGGEAFYAYVSLRPSQYEEFIRRVNAGENVNAENFGKILHRGLGEKPSEDVRRYVEEQFGVDHNFRETLLEALRQEAAKK